MYALSYIWQDAMFFGSLAFKGKWMADECIGLSLELWLETLRQCSVFYHYFAIILLYSDKIFFRWSILYRSN